jgi:hypothetical protein
MEELARVADDVEFSDSESDNEEEDYDPFGNIPQKRGRKEKKDQRRSTAKNVNIKQCVRLSTVDNFQVSLILFNSFP